MKMRYYGPLELPVRAHNALRNLFLSDDYVALAAAAFKRDKAAFRRKLEEMPNCGYRAQTAIVTALRRMEAPMKRKLSDNIVRTLVRSRATKGAAFMKGDYDALQREWTSRLEAMTRQEIFDVYPLYTYDIKL